MYRIAQVHRVRSFLTGKLLSTLLDLVTLAVLLPVLFYLKRALGLGGLGPARPRSC